MNRIEVKMDDLPELPFEKVLSYLSLEDRLKSKAVSRRWYNKIDSFKVKSLCFSERPSGFIEGKSRWVSGAFAQNFINSTRFESFFSVFGHSTLSNLKHLRLCDLRPSAKNGPPLAQALNSFGQLEELSIIRFDLHAKIELELNLPMLNSIHLKNVYGIEKLTLDAPRLQKAELKYARLRVELVHAESVERLITDCFEQIAVMNLKNLKYLYCQNHPPLTLLRPIRSWNISMFDSTFLSGLKQLNEIHVYCFNEIPNLFEQKERYGRVDLKIFLCGLLQAAPGYRLDLFLTSGQNFSYLAKHHSRLADEIPFYQFLVCYEEIESVASGLAIDIFKRFTDLSVIIVFRPVRSVQRFLDLLKHSNNINQLRFEGDQPQDLFDRFPEHCSVQGLAFENVVLDFEFLFRLKNLKCLSLDHSINVKSVRKVVEQLQFLDLFSFKHLNKPVQLMISPSKRFKVFVDKKQKRVRDLNAAIQFITKNTQQKNKKTT